MLFRSVFFGRLLPVVRTYISFPAGLGRMGVSRFLLFTLLGSIPWNFGLAYAGFRLGQQYHQIEQTFGWLTIPIGLAVLALLVVAYLLGRRWLEHETASEPGSAA